MTRRRAEQEEHFTVNPPQHRCNSPEPLAWTFPFLMSSILSLTSARPLFTAPKWNCRWKSLWSLAVSSCLVLARGAVASSKL